MVTELIQELTNFNLFIKYIIDLLNSVFYLFFTMKLILISMRSVCQKIYCKKLVYFLKQFILYFKIINYNKAFKILKFIILEVLFYWTLIRIQILTSTFNPD